MTRLEYLSIIYLLKALCERKDYEKLEEVLNKVIKEAERGG